MSIDGIAIHIPQATLDQSSVCGNSSDHSLASIEILYLKEP